MDKKEFRRLAKKYLAGNATDAEKHFIETYYKELQSGITIEDFLSEEEAETMDAEMLLNIKRRISQPGSKKTIIRDINWKRYASVAALLLVFLSFGLWFLNKSNNEIGQAKYSNLYNKRGQVSKVKLSDGTIVWLNADSKLSCPETFAGVTNREVYLEGEAYFEVAKDKKHPFLVHTRSLTTRVLGTRFDVKAYANNKTIQVTLLEGKVMLTAGAGSVNHRKIDTLYLKPNEKAYYTTEMAFTKVTSDIPAQLKAGTRDSGKNPVADVRSNHLPLLKIPVNDASIAASWKDGKLVFDQEPLENVIATLNRKYNVSINAKGNMLDMPISLNVSNEPIENVLLSVTRQLRRRGTNGNAEGDERQFKKIGSQYYIE